MLFYLYNVMIVLTFCLLQRRRKRRRRSRKKSDTHHPTENHPVLVNRIEWMWNRRSMTQVTINIPAGWLVMWLRVRERGREPGDKIVRARMRRRRLAPKNGAEMKKISTWMLSIVALPIEKSLDMSTLIIMDPERSGNRRIEGLVIRIWTEGSILWTDMINISQRDHTTWIVPDTTNLIAGLDPEVQIKKHIWRECPEQNHHSDGIMQTLEGGEFERDMNETSPEFR